MKWHSRNPHHLYFMQMSANPTAHSRTHTYKWISERVLLPTFVRAEQLSHSVEVLKGNNKKCSRRNCSQKNCAFAPPITAHWALPCGPGSLEACLACLRWLYVELEPQTICSFRLQKRMYIMFMCLVAASCVGTFVAVCPKYFTITHGA